MYVCVLEQVDQLVELMTEEKDTLTKRISELEVGTSVTSSPSPFYKGYLEMRLLYLQLDSTADSVLTYHHTSNYAQQAKLEAVGKKGSSLEEDKQQLQTECNATKRRLEELQEKHSKVCEHTRTSKFSMVCIGHLGCKIFNFLTEFLLGEAGAERGTVCSKEGIKRNKEEGGVTDL